MAARTMQALDTPTASGCDMNSFVGGYPIPHFNQAKPISLSL